MEQSTNNMIGAAERKEMDWGGKEGTNNVKVCAGLVQWVLTTNWANKNTTQTYFMFKEWA